MSKIQISCTVLVSPTAELTVSFRRRNLNPTLAKFPLSACFFLPLLIMDLSHLLVEDLEGKKRRGDGDHMLLDDR